MFTVVPRFEFGSARPWNVFLKFSLFMICQSLKHSPDTTTSLLLLPHPQPCQLWRQNICAFVAVPRPGWDSGVLAPPMSLLSSRLATRALGKWREDHCVSLSLLRGWGFSTFPTPLLHSCARPAHRCEARCRELSECKVQGKR